MPLRDFWCPACGTAFEAIVASAAATARCAYCFGTAREGAPGDPPSSLARLVAEARRQGTVDSEREAELGHFETSDADTLLDLDWDHRGKQVLEEACMRLQASWAELQDELFGAYYDAFHAAAPTSP
jgi:hypothetical protein